MVLQKISILLILLLFATVPGCSCQGEGMANLILVILAVIVIAFILKLLGSSKSGVGNHYVESAVGMGPVYTGEEEDEVKKSSPVESVDSAPQTKKNWQAPMPSGMFFRRLLGITVVAGVFILLNPMGEAPNYFRMFLSAIVGLVCGIYLNPGNLFIVPSREYIKWYRLFSTEGGARQVMSFKGEAGWQPEKKLQGWRYVVVAWNDVFFFGFTEVPSGAIAYLRSRIGETLGAGRKTAKCMPRTIEVEGNATNVESTYFYENPRDFIKASGQLNVQRIILTPGYVGPIDLIAFEVDDGTLGDSSPEDYYIPFVVPDDKFCMVTCLDSEYRPPQGAVFSRLGGFTDIQNVIKKAFGEEEAELEVSNPNQVDTSKTEAKPAVEVKEYKSIFRLDVSKERSVAGKCLNLLLDGPQDKVEDYQNIIEFDELKGTVGEHWRLIRPGRVLNLNRFVFRPTLVEPLKVQEGYARVLILSTGVLARDITRKEFAGNRIVRVGGNGINLKALEPAQYPIPSNLLSYVDVPTRQLSLFFQTGKSANEFDAALGSIIERTKDGVPVTYDFNVILTIPAEAATLVVSAFGTPQSFIKEIIASIVVGVTVEFIRSNIIEDIVGKQSEVLEDIKKKLEAAVLSLYGVTIQQVKMEHFAADNYLMVLEREVTAKAEKKAVIAETSVQEEKKNLETKKGEAVANYTKAEAEGKAKAIKLTYGAIVEQIGKNGAIIIEAFEKLTQGKYPFMPTTLGVAGNSDNGANSLLPVMALLSGALNQSKLTESTEVKKTDS